MRIALCATIYKAMPPSLQIRDSGGGGMQRTPEALSRKVCILFDGSAGGFIHILYITTHDNENIKCIVYLCRL